MSRSAFLFLLAGSVNLLQTDKIMIETPVGLISGLKSSEDYYAFYGIPYGTVNRTNLFGAPSPRPKFTDIFEAVDDSTICPQIRNNIPQGSIDCLQLNIFVPVSSNIEHRLPVMVYIHGGSFKDGSKSTDLIGPKYLVRHDVILVVINYRLGPYGFMCLDIPEVPGNQGLKDQELALRWIKKNIGSFGGDLTKITVFGISAGGHSIEFHILSDNEILFNNAILQSGSAVAATVFTDHDKRAPIRIAEKIGFVTDSLIEAIEYISLVDTNVVIQASEDLSITYKPCVEQKFNDVAPFLTKNWITAEMPKAIDMPILLGFCEHELLLIHLNKNNSDITTVIRNRLIDTFTFDDEKLNEMTDVIQDFYLSNKIVESGLIPAPVYFDSDFTYIHPVQRSIKKFLESKAKNVFYYMFAYSGGRNMAKIRQKVTLGSAAHSDDAGYLFDMDILAEKPAVEDQLVLDRVTTLWTNFAKYGDPSPNTSDLLNVKWIPLSKESYAYLKISTNLSIEQNPAADRMSFWDNFYAISEKYQKGYCKI